MPKRSGSSSSLLRDMSRKTPVEMHLISHMHNAIGGLARIEHKEASYIWHSMVVTEVGQRPRSRRPKRHLQAFDTAAVKSFRIWRRTWAARSALEIEMVLHCSIAHINICVGRGRFALNAVSSLLFHHCDRPFPNGRWSIIYHGDIACQ